MIAAGRSPRGAEAIDPPGGPTARGHEALLVRHRLVSHIAQLAEGASAEDADRFQREASRRARNLIRLAPRRFGLLLDGGGESLSDVAHSLQRAGPEAGRPGGNGAAPVLAGEAALRLDAIEARLEALGPEAIAAALAPAIDDLVSRRFEAATATLAETLTGSLAETVTGTLAGTPSPDPFPDDRIASFWTGLEQALRLLHGTAERMEAAAPDTREGGGGLDGIARALQDLEAGVALGFEAAGEAREANHAALRDRLARLDQAPSLQPSDLEIATDRLADRLDRLDGRLGEESDGVIALLDGLARRIDAVLARADADGDGTAEALAAMAERLDAAVARPGGQAAAPTEVDGAEAPEGEGAVTVQDLADRFDALAERLEGRGGILSEAVETSHRSMRNFWVAAEDALGRLDESLSRLDAATEADGQVAAGTAADASDDVAWKGRVEAIHDRLGRIEDRLEARASEASDLRRAFADLLGRKTSGARPD